MVNTVKVILATLVIFGAGVITGAVAVRIARTNPPFPVASRPAAVPAPNGPAFVALNTPFNRPDFLNRMMNEVGLRPDQRERIEAILVESRGRTEPIALEVRPKIRAEVQRVREQIAQVLDPAQRGRFNELMRAGLNQGPATNSAARGVRRAADAPPQPAAGGAVSR